MKEGKIMDTVNSNARVRALFIDYESYDIHPCAPRGQEYIDWFRCDKEIAETISILNKKGYITDANS